MGTAVVVPWRPGCPHRGAAWQWVRTRYATVHPTWEIIEGAAPDGPWCKAAAVHDALERTDADTLVIADADVWCDEIPDQVETWARPHDLVHRLTAEATAAYMNGQPATDCHVVPYRGVDGGGIVIIRRDLYEQIPMDPRFRGWGGEDVSWGEALRTLVGPAESYDLPLWHLWHPPQADAPTRRGIGGGRYMNDPNRDLHERYKSARKRPDQMAALIEEARAWRTSASSSTERASATC